MYAVILAGGKGERLWPKSTSGRAKHMLSFGTKNAMIQETIKRLKEFLTLEKIFLITIKSQLSSLKPYISILDKRNIILEPEGKDTACAICLAALTIEKRLCNEAMVVLPTDHIIKNSELFFKNLMTAEKIANIDNALVTIGIKPKYASVGYGYIELGKKLSDCCTAKHFTEKPKKQIAERFCRDKSSHYLWNSGIFVWKTNSILSALKRHMPNLYYSMEDVVRFENTRAFSIKLANEYSKLRAISIDYGLMEPIAKNKSQDIFCVKAEFDWIDVGSWSSVEEIYDKDNKGNIVLSNSVMIDVKDSTIIGERGHKIGIIGVKDLIIVQTKTGTLVCNKNRAQEVKDLVKNF